MSSFILDTNIIIDAFSANILHCLKFSGFMVSQVVFQEEVIKQISVCNNDLNLINESFDELVSANNYHENNKHISFYDALNFTIAKQRKWTLVTGDQNLVKFANKNDVNCIGTLKLIEILVDRKLVGIEESINALTKLKQDVTRRIPHHLIDIMIKKLEDMLVLAK